MLSNAIHLSPEQLVEHSGTIENVVGLTIESIGPQAAIGELLQLCTLLGKHIANCEVVGFRENRIISMVLGHTHSLMPGMKLVATGSHLKSHSVLRCLDGF